MKPLSIGFRLALLFSLLLLAGLLSLGAVLWFGVEYNMVAAVDALLEARAANLERFVGNEFGNVFVESPGDSNKGEFRGTIEQVDPARGWIAMHGGTRIRLNRETWFEGSLTAARLRAGPFSEIEVERAAPTAEWVAQTAAVVTNLEKELKEMLAEYALTMPDGRLIQLRSERGELLLPSDYTPGSNLPQAEVPWQLHAAPGSSTIKAAAADGGGAYRLLSRTLSMPGGTYHLQIAASLAAVASTRAGLLGWLWWVVPLTILLSFGGGYLVSRAALRPLEQFAGVASRITAHHLSERLSMPGTGDVIDRLARTFNSMLGRLESSVGALDEFTADASHELRGPVSVIRTTADLALRQSGRNDEELRKDMRGIQSEAVRLTELIDDLLTLARADSAELPDAVPPMVELDVATMIHEIVQQFRRQPGSPLIHAEVTDPEFSYFIFGHASSLRRLVLVLADNAVRHNAETVSVRVSVAREGNRIVLAVADNGQGIPAHALPRLFDRFYRVDPSRNRSSGAGLGLAIAKRIAIYHGGEITVSSALGQGATFRVSLPLCSRVREDDQAAGLISPPLARQAKTE